MQRPSIKPYVLTLIVTLLVLPITLFALSPWYELVINRSNSLPGLLFLLDKTRAPLCGETTALDMPRSARFYAGSRLIKRIKGCPGDMIVTQGQTLLINQVPVGKAMDHTSDGRYQLSMTPMKIIPKNHVYLAATHPQSYDSRYASFGLREQSELLGTAHLIF